MSNSKELRVLAGIRREWSQCQRCPLGRDACRHVLYEIPEGHIKADVLLIGEAPGVSEDGVGRPFIGRSGRFLRKVIDRANEPHGLVIAFSNLLACRPTGADGKDRKPAADEVAECSPRLVSIVQAFEPLAIVGLGRVPEFFLPPIIEEAGWHGDTAWFRHPAYLLRRGGESSPEFPDYLAAFEELFEAIARSKTAPPGLPVLEEKPPFGVGGVFVVKGVKP